MRNTNIMGLMATACVRGSPAAAGAMQGRRCPAVLPRPSRPDQQPRASRNRRPIGASQSSRAGHSALTGSSRILRDTEILAGKKKVTAVVVKTWGSESPSQYISVNGHTTRAPPGVPHTRASLEPGTSGFSTLRINHDLGDLKAQSGAASKTA